VRQNPWVVNLLKFKANGNSVEEITSPNILNALQFLASPEDHTTVLSLKHRKQILETMGFDENQVPQFNSLVFELFSDQSDLLNPVNPMNWGAIISILLYRRRFREQWDEALQEKIREKEAAGEEVPATEPEEEKKFQERVLEVEDLQEEEETEEREKEALSIILNISGSPTAQSDRTAERDQLGRQHIVDALAKMISHREQEAPFTIGVFGNWGSGKSSLVDLVFRQVKSLHAGKNKYFKQFKIITFNAWEYERTENIAVGLTQEVVKGLVGEELLHRKFIIRTKYAFTMHKWSSRISLFGLLALFAFSVWNYLAKEQVKTETQEYKSYETLGTLPDTLDRKEEVVIIKRDHSFITTNTVTRQFLENDSILTTSTVKTEPTSEAKDENESFDAWYLLKQFSSGGGVLFLLYFFKRLSDNPLTTKFLSNTKIPDYKDQLGIIPLLKEQMAVLSKITVGERKRMIVFVDDLDRCSKKTIMKTLEAVHRVLYSTNAIVIIAIDHRIALSAIASSIEDEDPIRTKDEVARDFLGKIIQLPLRINDPTDESIANYIDQTLFTKKVN